MVARLRWAGAHNKRKMAAILQHWWLCCPKIKVDENITVSKTLCIAIIKTTKKCKASTAVQSNWKLLIHVELRAGTEQRRHRASTRVALCPDDSVTFRDDKDAAEWVDQPFYCRWKKCSLKLLKLTSNGFKMCPQLLGSYTRPRILFITS